MDTTQSPLLEPEHETEQTLLNPAELDAADKMHVCVWSRFVHVSQKCSGEKERETGWLLRSASILL